MNTPLCTFARRVGLSLLLGTLIAAQSNAAETSEPVPRIGPRYDPAIVDRHEQIADFSCIPSSVELVLKMLGRVPLDYFDLQRSWKVRADACFDDFENRTIAGVTFHRKYAMARCPMFPLKAMFAAIDAELAAGRYVIVGLRNEDGSFHAWVIVERLPTGEYRAVSKNQKTTIEHIEVKKWITGMQGTDLGIYTLGPAERAPAT